MTALASLAIVTVLTIRNGAPTRSVAHLLHDVDQAAKPASSGVGSGPTR
jgi:hypothetical protein